MSKAAIFRVTRKTMTIKSWTKYQSEKPKGSGNMGQFHDEVGCKISSVNLSLLNGSH